jgi:serpin B
MTGYPRGLRVAVAVGTATALAACGTAGATPRVQRGDAVPVQTGVLTAGDVAAMQTAFGVDLLHAVCERADGENLLLSPTSTAEALSLLYPAAGGQTAESFRSVLHLPAWSPDLVAALRNHTRALDGLRYDGDLDDDAPDALQMSNRLWTATGLAPDPQYLDDLATAFDADVRALDFAGDPGGATDRINSTVDEDTRGIIEELFEDPLDRDTMAVLTNALHLKARWADPFTDTRSAPFDAPSGEVDVDMMSGSSGTGRTTEGWQSVELPYRDGTLAAVAVLPPEGTDPCTVDAATLADLQTAVPEEVGVQLRSWRSSRRTRYSTCSPRWGFRSTGTTRGSAGTICSSRRWCRRRSSRSTRTAPRRPRRPAWPSKRCRRRRRSRAWSSTARSSSCSPTRRRARRCSSPWSPTRRPETHASPGGCTGRGSRVIGSQADRSTRSVKADPVRPSGSQQLCGRSAGISAGVVPSGRKYVT